MLRLTSDQEREDDFRWTAASALTRQRVRNLGQGKFDPESLAWQVVETLNFEAKDDGFVRKCVWRRVKDHLIMPELRKVQNGLRVFIPIGGGLWQYAPSVTARIVRTFGNNYAEIEQSAGARRERVEEVLHQHEQLGFNLDDPITVAYEAALESVERQAA